CGAGDNGKTTTTTTTNNVASAPTAKSGEIVVVEVVRARALSGGQDVVATGAFRREREIELSFRIPGVLRQVNFREGDVIAKGALVAAIDPTQVDAQIAQAQAQASQAVAGIGQAQEQANAASSSILAARAAYAQALAGVEQADANVGRAQAGLAQARADYDNANRDLNRDQTLASKGFVSGARLDSRQTRVDVARAGVSAAQANVRAAQQTAVAARAGINAASAGINQAQAGAGAAVAGVRAAAGRSAAAEAGVNAAAFDRRWARLSAPAEGVVLTRLAEPGEVTAPGQAIMIMADEQSPLILRTPVSDRDVVRIKVGDPARIGVSAIGAQLSGQVIRVAQRADPRTGAFDVDISVSNATGVKTGFFGQARILATAGNLTPQGQVLVPAESLIEARQSKATVFVVAEGAKTVSRREIGFVGFSGDNAIVTGLPVGAAIVTSGGGYVGDGGAVAIVERQAP
ncbi:MAG: HlyD family efflux transporter periplasmic adaptor subunit, partial [Hyphomonadaceae bacterium]|nr:HlyD family efflux transporter periplasmic adaptor subunit [Hyphomonadaceae bacterium]